MQAPSEDEQRSDGQSEPLPVPCLLLSGSHSILLGHLVVQFFFRTGLGNRKKALDFLLETTHG
eukprot:278372-Rhodomonas_salina.1